MNKLVHLAMRAVNHITNEGHARHGRMLSVSPGAIQKFLSWYLRPEIHPASERIRIICISGEKLFGARETNQDRPLGEWARRGKLDVVMPVSRADNPTISERAQRYCECRHQKALIRWCVAVPIPCEIPDARHEQNRRHDSEGAFAAFVHGTKCTSSPDVRQARSGFGSCGIKLT